MSDFEGLGTSPVMEGRLLEPVDFPDFRRPPAAFGVTLLGFSRFFLRDFWWVLQSVGDVTRHSFVGSSIVFPFTFKVSPSPKFPWLHHF